MGINHVLQEFSYSLDLPLPIAATTGCSLPGGLNQCEDVTASSGDAYHLPKEMWEIEDYALETQHKRHPLVVGLK